ncbi:MAG: hypothetical protein AAGG11_18150 [Pseudomonadota bacterium]
MKKLLTVAALAALMGGCAATPTNSAPTHRWVSSEVVSEMQYARDHQRCLSQAGINGSAKRLDPSNGNHADYTSCMNGQGYELTASADDRNRSPSISH